MEDKNESKKIMEEMKRIGEGFNKLIESIGEALNELFYPKEDGWKMKIPYKYGDEYWFIFDNGHIDIDCWEGHATDGDRFKIGNAYPTEEAALLEAKRRNLLTRFRAFRDECNRDWKVDWSNQDKKWGITNIEEGMYAMWTIELNSFLYFGYFKNQADCERAIELFGDEIIELYVDNEV